MNKVLIEQHPNHVMIELAKPSNFVKNYIVNKFKCEQHKIANLHMVEVIDNSHEYAFEYVVEFNTWRIYKIVKEDFPLFYKNFLALHQ